MSDQRSNTKNEQNPSQDEIVREELELLDLVSAGLENRSSSSIDVEKNVIKELELIREELLRGKPDMLERSALTTRWTVQSSLLKRLQENRAAPVVDPECPYFAHLCLEEAGKERDVCIGRATCLENGLRIVDWRHAPIAKIFYRYRQGEFYEEEVSGQTREGEVISRRTVSISGGKLHRIEAPEGIYNSLGENNWERKSNKTPKLAGGEGFALRFHTEGQGSERKLGTTILGKTDRIDRRLPDIAGLIDPAQFSLISRPSSGFVAIRGAAGSGKTTVALHRIAYLAYEDESLNSADTLFLVFSPALRDYVAHVLPALGVPNVRILTFGEWAGDLRHRLFPRLPREQRANTPGLVERLKLHPALGKALEARVSDNPGTADVNQVIDDWGSVLTQVDLLEKVFREHAPDAFSRRQLEEICTWCRKAHEELSNALSGDPNAKPELDPEDDALLLRAWQLRIGPLPGANRRSLAYKHIAIDEVQDFSPLEVRVLLDCLDEQKSVTLAGDTQQHLVKDSGFTSWEKFFNDLGIAGTEVNTLEVSYRSSRPITDFALSVLGELRDVNTPVTTVREGPPVECFEFTDEGACVAFLAESLCALASEEPLASIALLTPDEQISESYYSGLSDSDVPGIHLVTHQDFQFGPGVEITEIDQAKGLEFDYVIIISASAVHYPANAEARRRLHVGSTRAIHQLWLMTTEPISPVVSESMLNSELDKPSEGCG